MRTGSPLALAALIIVLFGHAAFARPISAPIVRPVVRGIFVVPRFSHASFHSYPWLRRWHNRHWAQRRFDRFGASTGEENGLWVPISTGANGYSYATGPDAPYTGSAIFYPPGAKKQKSQSDQDSKLRTSGTKRLPVIVYGLQPERLSPGPSVIYGPH